MPEASTTPSTKSWVRRVFLNVRERRLRAGWRLLVALVVLGVGSLAVGSVVGLVSLVITGGTGTTAGMGTQSFIDSTQFVFYVVMTCLLVGLAWFVDRRTIPDVGLGGEGWWRNLSFGLVLGVVMTSTVFIAELATGLVTVDGVLVVHSGGDIGTALPVVVVLALTAVFFVAVGVFEELLVRGYLMTNIAEGFSGLDPVGPRGAIGIAAGITAALFGVLHLGNPGATLLSTVNITAVGLFFAGTYVATDDLGVPIGVHVTWNFTLSSVYGFPVSGITTPATVIDTGRTGNPLVTGGAFGPEAGLVLYVALAVGVAFTWVWVRWTEGAVGFPADVAIPDLRTGTGDDDGH